MALSVNRPLTYHIIQLMCRARRRPRVQRLRWHRRASRPPSCVATYHGRRRMLAVAPSGTHGRMQAAYASGARHRCRPRHRHRPSRAVARHGARLRPPFCRAPHRSQPSPLSPSAQPIRSTLRLLACHDPLLPATSPTGGAPSGRATCRSPRPCALSPKTRRRQCLAWQTIQ